MAFGYYKSVTIDHTQCGATNSTDFPVAIWITDADFKTVGNGGYVQNSSGFDIRPYADSGLSSALTFELVASTYVAATGAFEMHVKIPTVNHSTNVVFYLAFGDSGVSTDGSSTATWSNNFLLVAHLPNGSSLTLGDSSGNGYTGTNSGGTATAGLLDGGAAVTGGTEITFPGTALDALLNATDWTVSMWVNPTTLGFYNAMFDTAHRELTLLVNSSLIAYGAAGANEGGLSGTFTYPTGDWTLMHWVFTFPVVATWYANGAVDLFTSFPPGAARPTDTWELGVGYGGASNWDGKYDEVRLATVARSADWLTTEYNNQKPSSTFLSYGARTPTGGGATPTTRLPLLGVG